MDRLNFLSQDEITNPFTKPLYAFSAKWAMYGLIKKALIF